MIKETMTDILQICCDEFEVTIDNVRSKSRRQEEVYCRKAFCIIIKELYDMKNSTVSEVLNKNEQYIGYYVNSQPTSKYYAMTLRTIRNRMKNEIRDM